MNSHDDNLPEYLSISQMAQLMNLSRSRIYQLIEQGILLKPVYLLNNKRPVFTKEMAIRNIEVKSKNQGINGEILLFYSGRKTNHAASKKKARKVTESVAKNNQYAELIDALESLGLNGVSPAQVDSAIRVCFPDTIPDPNDDETLATIFRYLKRQNSEHKQ